MSPHQEHCAAIMRENHGSLGGRERSTTKFRVAATAGRGLIGATLWSAYHVRRCFICGCFGRCKHREPDVELAVEEAIRRWWAA